jgi:putative DNA primase/helicase
MTTKSRPGPEKELQLIIPENLDAERTMLGFYLMGGAWREEVTAHAFAGERHQLIFHSMAAIHSAGEDIDRQRVAVELGEKKLKLVSVGYLADLGEGCYPEMKIEPYIRKLHDATAKRDILHHADILVTHIRSDDRTADELIQMGTAAFAGLHGGRNHQESAASWPEPLPVGSELPEVDQFDPLLLPEALRDFVEDVAERMQVPPDYCAACLMVAMAGAVSRRAVIQPKAQDSSWVVTPNLWGGIIGPPGFLKSPVLNAVAAPLYAQEAVWRAEYKSDLSNYEAEQEELGLRLTAWKQETTKAFRTCKQPPARPDTSIQAPIPKRLVTSDSTFEKLHVLMNQNPAGLLVVRDELTGWWAELDREGRQGERGFFLSAWNGDTPYTTDRIGRETIHVPHCCVSMIGGITPGRLRSYMVDALQDGPSNDGLLQRFQVLVYPDPPRDFQYVDRQPQKHQAIWQMFERILQWDPDLIVHFRFNAEAQEFFVDWLGRLERKIRSGELHPALVSHLSKYRKLMPALGLLLGTAEQLTTIGGLHDPPLVFRENAEQAARWCAYLESHARRIYACVVTAAMQAAADLAAKIKKKEVEIDDGAFYVRDVYRHGWSRLDTPERALAALDILEASGWVRRAQNDPIPGRPPNRYIVNPRVHHAE